uniref:G1 to S phase transition protein n=1 Tax=Tetraselmis sp. GSL018 TaxID=582737 RepID=A0A061S9M0_9CHLO|mmetsp:Transcript_273/g.551  ORF Transcript_273/g.551 Transcript_273/m.551 type:complete len:578 (-) Transcript_273:241-1974(-)
MADSWEDKADEEISPKPKSGLNPNAPTFSFNPNAKPFSFTPGAALGTAAAPAPQPAPAAAGVAATSEEPQESATKDSAPSEAMQKLQVSDQSSTDAKPAAEAKPAPPKAPEPEQLDEEDKRKENIDKILKELEEEDTREHMNIVFIGHVDAGKSTTGGQILLLTGGVDDRTIQKYEREAKEKNRESWYMAYIMDTNEEERMKGKTVEVGRANFETAKRRYTILDAPGHKNYVPNMIGGAAQADIGVLIIAARKGEFETGFEKGGQTREHAQLAKTLGVAKLVVAINKMDDPSISVDGVWSQERYDDVEKRLSPFLKQCGYNVKRDVKFVPISGLRGDNIKDRVDKSICPWYTGPSLFEILDEIEPLTRDPHGSFRMPVLDKYKDMGTVVMGKSEAGVVKLDDRLMLLPNKNLVKVVNIYRDDTEVKAAKTGENLRLRLSGVEEEEVSSGMVVSSRLDPCPVVHQFETQLAILDLLEHKPILSAGYKAVLHIHCAVEECEIIKLVSVLDQKTKEAKKAKFVKSGNIAFVRIRTERAVCVDLFEKVPQLGRFTLRDEGRTIAIGKITKLPEKKIVGGPN